MGEKGYLYEEGGEKVSLYVEPALLARAGQLAQAHRRSLSFMVNEGLRLGFGFPSLLAEEAMQARRKGTDAHRD